MRTIQKFASAVVMRSMLASMSPKGKVVALCAICAAWLLLDQVVKALLSGYAQGMVVCSILFGLIDIRIVFNTGAAWGIFAGNPVLLGVVSVAVCALLLAYFVWDLKGIPLVQIAGIALVIAGGVGNAIDRFAQGYVLDYLSTTFMDFPVFNVADIGVTCGIVLLLVGMFLGTGDVKRTGSKTPAHETKDDAVAEGEDAL